MKSFKKFKLFYILPLILILFVTGCYVGLEMAEKPEFKNLSQLKRFEGVIVGRVELVPELKSDEQNIDIQDSNFGYVSYDSRLINTVFFQVLKKCSSVKKTDVNLFKTFIPMGLEKFFFKKVRRKPFYIGIGKLWIEFNGNKLTEKAMIFPGCLKVSINHEDKAVYIGTLRYYRNKHNKIIRLEIVDNYKQANLVFRKRFKTQQNLSKALASRLK